MIKLSVIPVKNFKIILIDNFYNQEEYKAILDECLFLCDKRKLESPNRTSSATDQNGKILKSNNGLFLDDIYNKRNVSDILFYNRKIFQKEFMQKLSNIDIIYRYIESSTKDSTLISYYENGDYYEAHTDSAKITSISWFYCEPKSFSGGDLIVENEWKIDCLSNRTVIFPSIIKHEVTEIKMKDEDSNQKKGRFTLSVFIN